MLITGKTQSGALIFVPDQFFKKIREAWVIIRFHQIATFTVPDNIADTTDITGNYRFFQNSAPVDRSIFAARRY